MFYLLFVHFSTNSMFCVIVCVLVRQSTRHAGLPKVACLIFIFSVFVYETLFNVQTKCVHFCLCVLVRHNTRHTGFLHVARLFLLCSVFVYDTSVYVPTISFILLCLFQYAKIEGTLAFRRLLAAFLYVVFSYMVPFLCTDNLLCCLLCV